MQLVVEELVVQDMLQSCWCLEDITFTAGLGGQAGSCSNSLCLPVRTVIHGITVGLGGLNVVKTSCGILSNCGTGGTTSFIYGSTHIIASGGHYSDSGYGQTFGRWWRSGAIFTEPFRYFAVPNTPVINYNVFTNSKIANAIAGESKAYFSVGGAGGGSSVLTTGGNGGIFRCKFNEWVQCGCRIR